ncbi:PREDICTED: uncharacterized protein LOC109115797 [Nelumbo nucifera]|uniref:Uncharacterized protein LOC109115797 n=1 Tax=Nelumbo nucifera TaxID=4432 RepID=A0A1U8QA89_NELNU|nr:PREDICTED: uncharacterized protein LOC109115797 [Nelumbo nucifera]
MIQPLGFCAKGSEQKVCKLKKSLSGLKQSPRVWFGRFHQAVQQMGFKQCQTDHTLFVKKEQGRTLALIVYVDDIVITGDWVSDIQRVKNFLVTQFEVKDLGPLRYFLGIELVHFQQGFFISQRKYTLDLLKDIGKLGAKPVDNPIDVNHKLGDCNDEPIKDARQYQRLVGRLLYLSMTRPDIAYPVGVLSQFMHAPKAAHLEAVDRVLWYLKKFPGTGLLFKNHGHMKVEDLTSIDCSMCYFPTKSLYVGLHWSFPNFCSLKYNRGPTKEVDKNHEDL